VRRLSFAAILLAWSSSASAGRLSCKEVRSWLDAGDLSEDAILARFARHEGPVQRSIVACLGDDATPRMQEVLAALVQGETLEPPARSRYRIDLGDDPHRRVGEATARQIALTAPGAVPYVVLYDDEVLDTPDWFYELRDLVTLALVEGLPTDSVLASDPEALGERATDLLDDLTAGDARAVLRKSGYRRLVVLSRTTSSANADQLDLTIRIESLRDEDVWHAGLAFAASGEPSAPPPVVASARDAGAPEPAATSADAPVTGNGSRRLLARRGWIGASLGASGGYVFPGSPAIAVGTGPIGELYPTAWLLDSYSGGVALGTLAVSGRISVVRLDLEMSLGTLAPRAFFEDTSFLGAAGLVAQPGLAVGAGYGWRPVSVYAGWFVGAQSLSGGGIAEDVPDVFTPYALGTGLYPATGPQLWVDLFLDRYQDRTPRTRFGGSFVVRGLLTGVLPQLEVGARAVVVFGR
jgi:hypothetical protein